MVSWFTCYNTVLGNQNAVEVAEVVNAPVNPANVANPGDDPGAGNNMGQVVIQNIGNQRTLQNILAALDPYCIPRKNNNEII